ncbi:hypothetical protein FRACA_400034 [Frankia canadensis]|uniref:Uncharacterized protein n=1 Tax=Frankia canadensis TaxID=1836972 RepID=A0A2I2KWR2_9ACTN|nr:hypothetical protein [Frankia canadensis]SNQ50101.1 hypothetical protein FRACA_400034 [Frankia canadensis]SOU57391.1 hypothetical protein FRACA_400034 [Frankia canadensis]
MELSAESAAERRPGGMAELRGAPKVVDLAPSARDTETGRRLWDISEELTGVRFKLPPM